MPGEEYYTNTYSVVVIISIDNASVRCLNSRRFSDESMQMKLLKWFINIVPDKIN